MGRGFINGIIWGALVCVIILAVVTLNAPLPERSTPELALVEASDPQPEPMLEAVSEAILEAGPVADLEIAEPAVTSNEPVTTGTDVPLPAGSEFNRPPTEQPAALPGTDTDIGSAPNVGATAPDAQAVTNSPALNTQSAPLPDVVANLELPTQSLPQETDVATTSAVEDAPPPPAELQPAPLGLPLIETDPAAQQITERAPSRFETIGDATTQTAAEIPDIGVKVRAIEAFAAEFDAAETRPLMSIILIDDPSLGLDRSVLANFTFPVTFAINPARADAAEAAAFYRASGFEVVILSDALPDRAEASDVEVSLQAAFGIVPEAVAFMDTSANIVQSNRELLDAVVGVLTETGHGLVAYPRGLNAAEQTATRASVPAGTLFRELDQEQERATVITRYLDRAAFAAVQDGTVIVVGHTYPETVTALFSWALGDRSESVAMAPLSAVLLR